MDWIQVSVCCEPQGLEAVSAVLTELGAQEQEIVGDVESIRDVLESTRDYWDYIDENEVFPQAGEGASIRVYVSDDADGHAKLDEMAAELDRLRAMTAEELGFSPANLRIRTRTVAEEDWANAWRAFYQPMAIGQRLLLCPEWETPPQDDTRVLVRLEPGLVFGTGEHQTTQLCLEALQEHVQSGMRVLDLGCGSGILSVAALALGAERALAVDVDANARGIVRSNAALNGIADERIQVEIGDILASRSLQQTIAAAGPFDIVLSNIVADVLIALAPQVATLLAADGLWIGSGIITERLEDVRTAVQQAGFSIVQRQQKDDWHCLLAAHGTL